MKFSKLKRIYNSSTLFEGAIIKIDDNNFYYLSKVLRLKYLSKFRIFNEKDGEFKAQIQAVTKYDLTVTISNQLREPNILSDVILTLGICVIKGSKMNDAIDMAVQIGVDKIVPLISDRTQVRTINHDKLLSLMIGSAEQSERLSIPLLSSLILLDELKFYNGLIIFANENENSLNNLKTISKKDKNILVIIGPEGGFTDRELTMLSRWDNTVSISISKNVLRSETAVITALAHIQLLRGEP